MFKYSEISIHLCMTKKLPPQFLSSQMNSEKASEIFLDALHVKYCVAKTPFFTSHFFEKYLLFDLFQSKKHVLHFLVVKRFVR